MPAAPPADPRGNAPAVDRLHADGRLCAEIAEEADAEAMLHRALAGVERLFGFAKLVVLVPDEAGVKLSTIPSHGYPAFGFGSEVVVDEGTVGMAAALRRPLRICDMRRGQRYVTAVQAEALRTGSARIQSPSLPQARSQLAVPLLARGEMLGVLFVEIRTGVRLSLSDEGALSLVASQPATGLLLAERERVDTQPTSSARRAPWSPAHRRIDGSTSATIPSTAASS